MLNGAMTQMNARSMLRQRRRDAVSDTLLDAAEHVIGREGYDGATMQDIAKEAGQIILVQNNLQKVVEAIKVSKLTFKTIRQNLFWAFGYNIVAIPLAMTGLLNPIIAAAAMVFSSVSVVANSLRIYSHTNSKKDS